MLTESKGSIVEAERESDEEEEEKAEKKHKGQIEEKGPEKEKKGKPPTQFQEPDASSLLDAFGF